MFLVRIIVEFLIVQSHVGSRFRAWTRNRRFYNDVFKKNYFYEYSISTRESAPKIGAFRKFRSAGFRFERFFGLFERKITRPKNTRKFVNKPENRRQLRRFVCRTKTRKSHRSLNQVISVSKKTVYFSILGMVSLL